ncbi:hypothetical protein EH240_19795 [Mesorhizobium tamadayense]|uniref:Uncharacterized protein n=1 Tax=Mesorhizobium tamadayense TaxID=425306 RepID=A0A3P3FIV0_9HYPH|nr:hypothetical protein [Mesorhizobium tamadayense]RRH98042.1 hypothetical protein EH240_19795 [Mesorhizobium tamadayense]
MDTADHTTHAGRRRVLLGALDLVPDEGRPALCQAFDALMARRTQQIHILAMLNKQFGDLDLPAVSRSAFSRWALRVRSGDVARPGEQKPGAASPAEQRSSTLRAIIAVALRSLADRIEGRS